MPLDADQAELVRHAEVLDSAFRTSPRLIEALQFLSDRRHRAYLAMAVNPPYQAGHGFAATAILDFHAELVNLPAQAKALLQASTEEDEAEAHGSESPKTVFGRQPASDI